MSKCDLCNIDVNPLPVPGDIVEYNCSRCGHVRMTGRMSAVFINNRGYDKYKNIFSGITRYRTDYGLPVLTISSNHLEQLEDPGMLDSFFVPRSMTDRLNLLLKYMARKSDNPGANIDFNPDLDYPITFSKNAEEFQFYLDQLEYEALIHHVGGPVYILKVDGWNRFEELNRKIVKKNQAFIAMWFDPTMNDVYENGLRKAVVDSEYEPMKIDLKEHNNKIDDEIIAEIRNSGFLVADMTGHRGGVYFEAGFAMGLGIPVIWTCRKDCIDEVHFDTRQFNHIVWETPEELYQKLFNRIKATITI